MVDASSSVFGMSDDDFANLNGPDDLEGAAELAAAEAATKAAAAEAEPNGAVEPAAVEPGSETVVEDPITPAAGGGAKAAAEGSVAAPKVDGEGAAAGEADLTNPKPEVAAEAAVDPVTGKPVEKAAEPAANVDYEAGYKALMAPFKANGKTIEPRSIEEATALMQMGANYTRKMQEIKPHRSTIMMLQNAGLLDQNKLSFLIDLDKGDPEAVKKFIKDRGIDPLEIDTSTAPAYLGGNHRVSDADVSFNEVLDEVSSTPHGVELLKEVQTTWDTASKDMLYQNPSVMGFLNEQRESGVFSLIHDEVERQRTLGTLSPDIPFLQAYMQVGEQLVAAETSKTASAGAGDGTKTQVAPEVLGKTVADPKATVEAGDKAAAASPTRGTAPKVTGFVNPLSMADDDFLATMKDRV